MHDVRSVEHQVVDEFGEADDKLRDLGQCRAIAVGRDMPDVPLGPQWRRLTCCERSSTRRPWSPSWSMPTTPSVSGGLPPAGAATSRAVARPVPLNRRS